MFKFIDTKASEKITTIIQKKAFCKDVMKLSPKYQTSTCEAFHSVVINFAPKSTAFTYKGMRARYFNLGPTLTIIVVRELSPPARKRPWTFCLLHSI